MLKKLSVYGIVLAILLTGGAFAASKQPKQQGTQFANKSVSEEETANIFVPFDGEWKVGVAPLMVGGRHYITQKNMRSIDGGIEGVKGYTKVTASVIDQLYFKARSGYHFQKDRPPESHILLQSYDTNLQYSRIFDNQTPIPNVGIFDPSYLHEDESYAVLTGAYGQKTKWRDSLQSVWRDSLQTVWRDTTASNTLLSVDTPRARFSPAPNGQVVYCNGAESQIWAGNESRLASLIVSSNAVTNYVSDGKDYTIQANDAYDDAAGCVSAYSTGTTVYLLVAATRPISGATFYVKSANPSTGNTVYVQQFIGTAWADISNVTDSTYGMTSTGRVSFPSTVATSKLKYLSGGAFHWYQFRFEGSASISQVTLNYPWQDIRDIPDGVKRTCISFQVSRSGIEEDFTLEVNSPSNDLYPIGAKLGGLIAGDYIIAVFSDKQMGIDINMLSGNTNAFVNGATPYYWSGGVWTQPSYFYDGSAGITGATPWGQTGVITWSPTDEGEEFPKEHNGVQGYAYKIEIGGTLGFGQGNTEEIRDSVILDTCYGIAAPLSLKNFKFPVFYKNRVFLCGYLKGNEASRVDFCKANAPDVWNGLDSSDNGRASLYIGDDKELMGASSLFNRYGSDIYSVLLFFKRNEIYVMQGDTPAEFAAKMYRVSTTIGCPAPHTITTVELGYEMVSEELIRNVVVWLSSHGPMMFDGSVLQPIKGVEPYFNPADLLFVGQDAIENAFSWYNANRREWNLRVGDLWLVYDLIHRRWYETSTDAAHMPQCAFDVTTTGGIRYTYASIDNGYMVRLDDGNTWDGTAINQVVETGNFFGDEDPWHQTVMRRVGLTYVGVPESATVQLTAYLNDGAGVSIASIPITGTTDYAYRKIYGIKDLKSWCYRLKWSVSTSESHKGFRPVGWGYQVKIDREDK